MPKARIAVSRISVALALGLYAWVWLGPGPSAAGLGVFWRERLPRLPAEEDLAWLPGTGALAVWAFLGLCVFATAILERRREERVEPWALVSVLLVLVGSVAAYRGTQYIGELDLGGAAPRRSSAHDLAYGAWIAGIAASALALVKIAGAARRGDRRRGAGLATCALLIAPGNMFWVHTFVVAPVWAQPRTPGLDLELPLVPRAHLDYWVVRDRAELNLYPRAGEPRVRVGDEDVWGPELDAHLAEVAARMEKRPFVRNGEERLIPGDPILLRADARLPAGAVLEALEACRRAGIWKAQVATRYGEGYPEGRLWIYLSLLGETGFDESTPELQVRPSTGGADGALRYRAGTFESEDLVAVLRELNPVGPDWADTIEVSVDPELGWQAVVQALWHAVDESGVVVELTRLEDE